MFVNYIVANKEELPPVSGMYEYVFAGNGSFVRAKRPGLEVMFPVNPASTRIRGLEDGYATFLLSRRVPLSLVNEMFLTAWRAGNKEILFYLKLVCQEWALQIPEQVQSPGAVRPVDPYAGGADTILEVHSHHGMGAYFSGTDDREESAGFRLYAVLGRLNGKRPQIAARVGVYGHFWQVQASSIFELPGYADDVFSASNLVYEEIEDVA